jgi:type IV pilus assembly protein PilV
MIEVLVSALILVVGILSVAAMQVTALKNLQSSGNYGVASMMANDIADRMWVNCAQALANGYNHNSLPGAEPRDCVAGTCTAAEMAAHDVYDWQRQLQGYVTDSDVEVPEKLPAGQGSVAQVGGTGSYLITLQWDDDRSGSTGTTCPPADEDDLECYTVTVTLDPDFPGCS